MGISETTKDGQEALRRAMAYWAVHWDWECPLLFGIELDQLQRIVERWPWIAKEDESGTAATARAALRELLHGASARRNDEIEGLIGISFVQADALLLRLAD